MNEEDKILLDAYIQGFNDELDGRKSMWNQNPLLLSAYNLGRQNAIVGDDARNVDYQTNQEILNRIRNQNV
jgi:hypothetical protein